MNMIRDGVAWFNSLRHIMMHTTGSAVCSYFLSRIDLQVQSLRIYIHGIIILILVNTPYAHIDAFTDVMLTG
jgi:hypothetical protein